MTQAQRAGLRFLAALWLLMLAAHLAACGGGGDHPDMPTPGTPCTTHPEACR